MIVIRPESPIDYFSVKLVNDLAFDRENDSMMIEKLRNNPHFIPSLSLVAVFNTNVVGYILFFPLQILGTHASYTTLGLVRMAVLPSMQHKGIGKKLITTGFEFAKKEGFSSVVVLGQIDYYPQFGFRPASNWNIKVSFDVPDEAFMALELIPGIMNQISGKVQFPAEFDEI